MLKTPHLTRHTLRTPRRALYPLLSLRSGAPGENGYDSPLSLAAALLPWNRVSGYRSPGDRRRAGEV